MRHAGERLATLERVMRSLDPDSVLQRGYARVTDAAGRTLTTAATAGKELALTLRFRDGPLDVVPAGAPRPPRPKTALPPTGDQPKLL
jgi:exodeoxyribonuclease VII large subunit